MRIVYFGTAQFAVPPLHALLENRGRFDVVAVVTQPDKPAGRDATISATPVALAARAAGVPLLQPAKMKTDETRETLAALHADAFVVAAYGRIIPKALLDLPTRGCFNLHGSLLPKYRGASPIQAAIAEGETETGVTLMGMDEEVDHGPTYATTTVRIDPTDTHATLETKLADAAAQLLIDNLESAADGTLKAKPQRHEHATFTSVIDRRDGFVAWTDVDAATIERRRRAFTPWPGIYAIWKRKGAPHRIKLLDVAVMPSTEPGTRSAELQPGTVFKLADGFPAVAAKDGAVVLVQVQPEGKKPMDGRTMLNGYQDFVGSILENEETPA